MFWTSKLIVFPKVGKLKIERDKRFGGNLMIKSYDELEMQYSDKVLHPADLKAAISRELETIIAPIRKNFK